MWPQTHAQGERRVQTRAEITVMPQKPRNTAGCQQTTEAAGEAGTELPHRPQKEPTSSTPASRTPSLWSCGTTHSGCLSHSVCTTRLRPRQQTNCEGETEPRGVCPPAPNSPARWKYCLSTRGGRISNHCAVPPRLLELFHPIMGSRKVLSSPRTPVLHVPRHLGRGGARRGGPQGCRALEAAHKRTALDGLLSRRKHWRRLEAARNHLPTPDGWHGTTRPPHTPPAADWRTEPPRWATRGEVGFWRLSSRRHRNAPGSQIRSPGPSPPSWANATPPAPTNQGPVALHTWRRGSSVPTCPLHGEQVAAQHLSLSLSRWHMWLADAHRHSGRLGRAAPASSLQG